MIASTMISIGRNHLRSGIWPSLWACLPLASRSSSTAVVPPPNTISLSSFLLEKKQAFLADVKSNQGKGWTIVMGNEAGDLDSCASAIAMSYLSSTLDHTRMVALIQTPRHDLKLRRENLHAFGLANLDPINFLTIDDINTSLIPPPKLCTSFVLVDHNRLLPKFVANGDDRVTAIFDHHEDEGKHQNAKPRIIRTMGSCTSIVVDHYYDRFPKKDCATQDLATLLLSALVIDTKALKRRARRADLAARRLLFPLSIFDTPSIEPPLKTLLKALSKAKRDVSHLTGLELLRRDYKEYVFGSQSARNLTSVGLSTVPIGLHEWISRDGAATFWADQAEWIDQKGFTFSGVLTTFHTNKGHHKRELMFVFPPSTDGAAGNTPAGLEAKLYDGVESDKLLKVRNMCPKLEGIEERHARAWELGNDEANRKKVAPLIKRIVERGW